MPKRQGRPWRNPEKPEIFWTFEQATDGMAKACQVLNTPVIGGNVSFYNENNGEAIYPTPMIGMVGVIDNPKHITTMDFKNENDLIILLGQNKEELGGSEYLKEIHDLEKGAPPQCDINYEKQLQDLTLALIHQGLVNSAHDTSEGGLAVALAQSAFAGGFGMDISLDKIPYCGVQRDDTVLFSETNSRFVVTVAKEKREEFEKVMQGSSIAHIGFVLEKLVLIIRGLNERNIIQANIEDLKMAWKSTLEEI